MAAAFDHAPILQTTRLFLREVRASDVTDHYYRWLNDPAVTQYLEVRYTPQSKENIARFVAALDGKRDEILFAMCLVEDGRHIGNIKLGPINWIHGYGDISLLIGEKDCWGKGFATEAIHLVCRFGFHTLNLRKITAGAYAPNLGSINAFVKNGFAKEGCQKGKFLVAGQPVDNVLLGLLAADFKNHG